MTRPTSSLVSSAWLAALALAMSPDFASAQVEGPRAHDETVVVAKRDAAALTTYGQCLQRIVRPSGVDYAALRTDRADLDLYLKHISERALPAERTARIAHLVNVYNAYTLSFVETHLPRDVDAWRGWSITKALGEGKSPWKDARFRVAGVERTLDELEHELLRPLGEPRIHFAVNCASRSCPALAAVPLRADTLEAQLEAAARAFVTDALQLRRDARAVLTNPLLDWFAKDFEASGGVREFLRLRAPSDIAQSLEQGAALRFFEYDWALNLAVAEPASVKQGR